MPTSGSDSRRSTGRSSPSTGSSPAREPPRSGTISSWTIGRDGSLSLLATVAGTTDPVAGSQGSTPLDLRTSRDGRFLYDVLPGAGKVATWAIHADGDHAPSDFSALGSPAGIDVL